LGIEAGHSRREKREIWTIPVSQMGGLYQEEEWAGLQTLSGWRDTDISGIKPLTRSNSISRLYPVLLRLSGNSPALEY